MQYNRRQFIRQIAAGSSLLLTGCSGLQVKKSYSAHVVVVGGGFAGATAAKTIRQLDNMVKVTLIEPKSRYVTCPGSNWVLAGLTSLDSIRFSYQRLSTTYGIDVIAEQVESVDAEKQTLVLANQDQINYDRLIMAPGIDFNWDSIDGYSAEAANQIPHAWQAGRQTEILRQQIHAMPDNGLIVISAPANPFRCPPGPYERASLLAYYCQRHKPRAKILILDHKRGFSKQALFMQGWRRNYGYGTEQSLIEWQSITDNPVIAVSVKDKTLLTDFGDQIKADVLNIIPAQKAGQIAASSGLTDNSGWCPVQPDTAESTLRDKIHVIGDAAIYPGIPKSAFAANSEAKACAMAVVHLLKDKQPPEPVWINTCFSLLTPQQGISVAMVYKLNQQQQIYKVKGAGGVSSRTDSQSLHREAQIARNWYKSITQDVFALKPF